MPKTGVAVLPPGASFAQTPAHAIEDVCMLVFPPELVDESTVVLVDVTTPDGLVRLMSLSRDDDHPRSLVAVVDWARAADLANKVQAVCDADLVDVTSLA